MGAAKEAIRPVEVSGRRAPQAARVKQNHFSGFGRRVRGDQPSIQMHGYGRGCAGFEKARSRGVELNTYGGPCNSLPNYDYTCGSGGEFVRDQKIDLPWGNVEHAGRNTANQDRNPFECYRHCPSREVAGGKAIAIVSEVLSINRGDGIGRQGNTAVLTAALTMLATEFVSGVDVPISARAYATASSAHAILEPTRAASLRLPIMTLSM